MRIAWVNELPAGISVQAEEDALTRIEKLAEEARFKIVRADLSQDQDGPPSDLIIETPKGRVLFEVRRKTANNRARIDVETRPDGTYRTRHLLLEKLANQPWMLLNDSSMPEKNLLENSEAFRDLMERLFS
jgi:hypothetical protein